MSELKTKEPTLATIKNKLLKELQLYSRLYHADKNGYVKLYDTGKIVHWKKAQ